MVNTVTSYRSPVRLVKHAAEETEVYSSQAISRARKKMMAEIALAGDEVVIDDVAYSRNDASTLLDSITEQNWKVHSTIYAHKGLLDFLEKEEFNNEALRKADAYLYNAAFVQAVSPYFAHSFNTVSGKLIRQENFEELLQLLNYQGYILPEHSHEAYQKLRNYLDELNYTLRNLSWEKFFEDEAVLHFVFSDEWKRCINKLPSSFTALRDELVEQITNIVLRFQHKATWYYLHQVLVQLKTIETNDFNRSEVERIDKIIYENSRIEGGKTGRRRYKDDGEVSTGRIIWWVIWIIIVIVRVTTCNNRSSSTSSYDFQYDRFEKIEPKKTTSYLEERNEAVLRRFLDSLSRQPSLPQQPMPQPLQTGDQPFGSFAYAPETGTHEITIQNNTPYNCVLLYFPEPAPAGDVYEGSLSKTCAAYIKEGDTYSFSFTPNKRGLYFLFGEKWNRLKKAAELPVYGGREEDSSQLLFVYEFFSNKKPIDQKYLRQAVWLFDSSSYMESGYSRTLNVPEKSSKEGATDMILEADNHKINIKVKGVLMSREMLRVSKDVYSQ